jgi:hypothetical protein
MNNLSSIVVMDHQCAATVFAPFAMPLDSFPFTITFNKHSSMSRHLRYAVFIFFHRHSVRSHTDNLDPNFREGLDGRKIEEPSGDRRGSRSKDRSQVKR